MNLKKKIIKLTEKYAKNVTKTIFRPGIDIIPFAGRVFDEYEYINLVESALDAWLTSGKFTEEFEFKFAKYHGIKSCSLVNSGSSANLLAISALTSPKLGNRRLRSGDEIITLAAGFPTTVNPIIQNNAIPVFVDIDIPTYNIQTNLLQDAISERTKAIFIAHTLGNPFNVTEILSITKKYDLWLIEDCCDALGSKFDQKLVGTFGDIATVSFYPAHHITMGEGGALLTNNLQLEQIIRSFRDWGRDCYCEPGYSNTCARRFSQQFGSLPYGYDHKYVYSHIGFNLKITDMQAAVGLAQLNKLERFIAKRKENFKRLTQILEPYQEYIILPKATNLSDPSWFAYVITVRESAPFSRNNITTFLEMHKIMTRNMFAGNLIRQPAYSDVKYRVFHELTNTDNIMKNSFFIGLFPGITDQMLLYIKSIFDHFFKNLKKNDNHYKL